MAKKIMIVDDEPDILKVTVYRLKKAGFDVVISEDGNKALDLVRKEIPDLVLLDLNLPGITGDIICKYMKDDEHLKHIPVLFLTASVGTTNEQILKDSKAQGLITKPFDNEDLLMQINKLLG